AARFRASRPASFRPLSLPLRASSSGFRTVFFGSPLALLRSPQKRRPVHVGELRAVRPGRTSRKTAPARRIPMSTKNMMQLVAVVERGEGADKRGFWTRIGVAFENRDGSWTLRFDYLPARMSDTTIQLRAFDAKEDR